MLKRNDTVCSVVQTKDDTEVVFLKTLLDVLRKNTNYKNVQIWKFNTSTKETGVSPKLKK